MRENELDEEEEVDDAAGEQSVEEGVFGARVGVRGVVGDWGLGLLAEGGRECGEENRGFLVAQVGREALEEVADGVDVELAGEGLVGGVGGLGLGYGGFEERQACFRQRRFCVVEDVATLVGVFPACAGIVSCLRRRGGRWVWMRTSVVLDGAVSAMNVSAGSVHVALWSWPCRTR